MKLAGIVLVLVAVIDPLLVRFLVAPRLEDPRQRTVLMGAMVASSVLLIVLGALFLGGVLG